MRQCSSRRSEVSGATSSMRSTSSPWGTWTAASRWDSSHSFCSRTSISFDACGDLALRRVQVDASRPPCRKTPNPYPDYPAITSESVAMGALTSRARRTVLASLRTSALPHPTLPARDCAQTGLDAIGASRGSSGTGRAETTASTAARSRSVARPSSVLAISRRRRLSRSARQASRLAPRAVGAPHRGAPVQRPGRAPALARAVDERRRALPVVDDPAGRRVEPRPHAGRAARAGRGRCPRRTCAAPGRTGPRRRRSAVGPATQAPVSQLTSSGARAGRARSAPASRPAGARAGTRARTHGQAPTSGPLAEGWTVPSGFSTRGPTSAPSSSAAAASRSSPSSSSSVSGLSSTVASPAAAATPTLDAAPKPRFSLELDQAARALPGPGLLARALARGVVDDDQLLLAVEGSVHRRHEGAQVICALPGDDDYRVGADALSIEAAGAETRGALRGASRRSDSFAASRGRAHLAQPPDALLDRRVGREQAGDPAAAGTA